MNEQLRALGEYGRGELLAGRIPNDVLRAYLQRQLRAGVPWTHRTPEEDRDEREAMGPEALVQGVRRAALAGLAERAGAEEE